MSNMPQQPLVSIDAVPFIVHNNQLNVILGRRDYEPAAGLHALPGVLLNAHERISEATERALKTKVGVTEHLASSHVSVFDDFERDERGPTLSIAGLVIVDTPPADPRSILVPLHQVKNLPFDHEHIISVAAGVLLDSLWINKPLTRALLGETFTTADVIARMKELAHAAGRPTPESKNVGRKLGSNPDIIKSTAAPAGRGRPPASWNWTID